MADYSDEEAEEILKRALSRQRPAGISHEDLVAAASEVGLRRAEVEAAAAEIERERAELAKRGEVRRELRRRLGAYAANLVAINLLLVAIDHLTGPGWWFYWATLGSVFLLVRRAARSLAPSDEELRRVERRLERRRRRRERRQERHAWARAHRRQPPRKSRAEAEFERVVEQGVEALLRSAADRIERWGRDQDARRVRVEPHRPDDDSSPSAGEHAESTPAPSLRRRR